MSLAQSLGVRTSKGNIHPATVKRESMAGKGTRRPFRCLGHGVRMLSLPWGVVSWAAERFKPGCRIRV